MAFQLHRDGPELPLKPMTEVSTCNFPPPPLTASFGTFLDTTATLSGSIWGLLLTWFREKFVSLYARDLLPFLRKVPARFLFFWALMFLSSRRLDNPVCLGPGEQGHIQALLRG